MLLESGEMTVNSIRCGGHHACNVWTGLRDVRVATHLQACLELRSDSGIYGVSLKLFGPFPLAPGLTKHLLVSSSGEPGLACGPLPNGGPRQKGPRPLPGPLVRARGWVSRRWHWDLLGEAISCQPKQKSLKMLKRLRKRTLSICLTSLV